MYKYIIHDCNSEHKTYELFTARLKEKELEESGESIEHKTNNGQSAEGDYEVMQSHKQ